MAISKRAGKTLVPGSLLNVLSYKEATKSHLSSGDRLFDQVFNMIA